MSGGAYDYAYIRVLEFAEALEGGHDHRGIDRRSTPARLAFAEHLHLVAEAMRAIEYQDSGDGADAEAAIGACGVTFVRACGVTFDVSGSKP